MDVIALRMARHLPMYSNYPTNRAGRWVVNDFGATLVRGKTAKRSGEVNVRAVFHPLHSESLVVPTQGRRDAHRFTVGSTDGRGAARCGAWRGGAE